MSQKINTILFITLVNLIGWLSVFLATRIIENSILQQLMIIIFLLSPFLISLVLRTIGNDGWDNSGIKFNFKQSKKWYFFSLILFPIIIIITYIVSLLVLDKKESIMLISVVVTSVIMLLPMFLKNIGEEFGWRGYLEPQLKALGVKKILRHTITGIIWAMWHLPIIFFTEYTSENMITYLPRFFIGTIIFAFVYGQLREYSKTVWTSVILHTIGNSLGNTFIASYYFASHKHLGLVPESYLAMIIWSLIALFIFIKYKNKSI